MKHMRQCIGAVRHTVYTYRSEDWGTSFFHLATIPFAISPTKSCLRKEFTVFPTPVSCKGWKRINFTFYCMYPSSIFLFHLIPSQKLHLSIFDFLFSLQASGSLPGKNTEQRAHRFFISFREVMFQWKLPQKAYNATIQCLKDMNTACLMKSTRIGKTAQELMSETS